MVIHRINTLKLLVSIAHHHALLANLFTTAMNPRNPRNQANIPQNNIHLQINTQAAMHTFESREHAQNETHELAYKHDYPQALIHMTCRRTRSV